MSISIMWRPVKGGKRIPGTSSLWNSLEELFGRGPIRLDASHLEALRGFRAASQGDDRRAVDELAGAIEAHEAIELYATY